MRIKKGFVLEEVGGSYLAVATGRLADSFHSMIRLNGTSAFIWRQLEGDGLSREALVEAVVAAYDAPRATIEADVDALLGKLAAAGILEEEA